MSQERQQRTWFRFSLKRERRDTENKSHHRPQQAMAEIAGWVWSVVNHLSSKSPPVTISQTKILSLGTKLASTSSFSSLSSSSSTWSTTSSTPSSILRHLPVLLNQRRRHWCQPSASWRVMQPRTASWDCNPSVKETDIFYLRFKFWVGLVNHCVRTKSDVGSIKEATNILCSSRERTIWSWLQTVCKWTPPCCCCWCCNATYYLLMIHSRNRTVHFAGCSLCKGLSASSCFIPACSEFVHLHMSATVFPVHRYSLYHYSTIPHYIYHISCASRAIATHIDQRYSYLGLDQPSGYHEDHNGIIEMKLGHGIFVS